MTGLPRDPESNASRIREVVGPLARGCEGAAVFLVDGDRTLSPDDTSRAFLRLAGLDPLVIKERFERDGYCFDAFRFHAEMHVNLGAKVFDELAPVAARAAPLYAGAVEFLAAASSVAHVFVVSAGIPRIWRCILDDHHLPDVGVIGGIDPSTPFVFGRSEKAIVAGLFREWANPVVGVGDSDVDTELLALAHHAVVVVNHRRNADLLPHLTGHPSLWQVVPTGEAHEGIPIIDFPAIARLISTSPTCR